MCGIAGQFGIRDTTFAARALAALRHRGPDGSGAWESESATLVHTRLSILDLSEAGRQPMVFESKVEGRRSNGRNQWSDVGVQVGRDATASDVPSSFTDNRQLTTDNAPSFSAVLVFNGEIYNYRELRQELEAAGEEFTGDGDTEVLLRLLVREGAACLPKLAGMFAFAFWDASTGSALLARDPLGIKPLYIREDGGTLAFASETKVLRRDADPIDATALRDYFLWGSVPEPQTLQLAIRQLPAGHLLRWQNGNSAIQRWYDHPREEVRLTTTPHRVLWHGLPTPAIVTRAALEESIQRHLVSDVPVGIFLSGGIDSTALLALTRIALGPAADIRTFSIGFDDPAFDESAPARRTAEHFGANHTEWKMTTEEGTAEIPGFLEAMDQPGIDGFNTWCVSKLAQREGMKVVLSGLGGDEIFAGYASFWRVPQFHRWYRLAGLLRPAVAKVLESRPTGSPFRRLAAFLQGDGEWLQAYHVQRGIFTPQEADVLAKHLADTPAEPDWAISGLPENPRDVVGVLEITRYMRNQLLRDSDVYSMAHGLELRVPFVDARLLESITAIPAAIRLRQGKQLLLEAMPEIPDWVQNQPKRGFRFPFQSWMDLTFSEQLEQAQKNSPIELKVWYRTWALASAMRAIKG